MTRPLKYILALIAIAGALFAALIVAVMLLVEPEDYRSLLIDSVTRSTGRAFEVEGELALDVFPCCSVSLGAARLGNPQGFPSQYFAAFESAAASIRLWPLLLHREIEIGNIRIEGLDLDLTRLADGRASWTFEAGTPQPTAGASSSSSKGGFHVEGVEINGGRVNYRDLEACRHYMIENLSIRTGAADYHQALSLDAPDLQLTLTGDTLPDGTMDIDFSADRLVHAPGNAALEVLGLRLALDDSVISGDMTRDASGAGVMEFDLAMDQLDLDRYRANSGPTGANNHDNRNDNKSDNKKSDQNEPTRIPLEALGDLHAQGTLRISAVRVSGMDLAGIELTLASRSGQASVALAGAGLGGRFAFEGKGNVNGRDPHLAGTLEFADLAPRTLLAGLDPPLQTADPDALARLAATASFRLTPRTLALDPLTAQLDNTNMSGSLRIDDFDRHALRFDLELDRIDLDAYLPPRAEKDEKISRSAEAEPTPIPVELIRALDLNGRLRIAALRALEVELTAVEAGVRAEQGILRIDPLRAGLYGGEYHGTVTVDATGPMAVVALDQQLAGVQVGDVLQSRYDSDLLAGALNFSLTGSGTGMTTRELLRGLSGTVDLDLADGVYRGTDFLYEIRRAQALLQQQPAPAAPTNEETPISALNMQGRLADGVMRSDAIRLETPFLRLGGKGGLDLVDLLLDYKFDAELLQTGANAGDSDLSKLLGGTIPLTVKGAVDAPKVRVDLERMLKDRAKQSLEQRALELLGGRKSGTTERDQSKTTTQDSGGDNSDPGSAADSGKEPSTKDLLKRSLRDLLAPKDENN